MNGLGTPDTTRTPSDSGAGCVYGHACAECTRGKVKCVQRWDGICERCHRLNKGCTASTSKRKLKSSEPRQTKRVKKAAGASSVEKKLDELYSLLKPSPAAQPEAVPSHQYRPARDVRANDITDAELATALVTFRERLRYFPFIDLPSTTTPRQLKTDRPCLSLAIAAIESQAAYRQGQLNTQLRQVLAQELVAKLNSTLDVLLAVLAFLGWLMYQPRKGDEAFRGDDTLKPAICILSQLAMSGIYDLGLNKPPFREQSQVVDLDFGPVTAQARPDSVGGQTTGYSPSRSSAPRTNETKRAVLGCFLITSIASTVIKRIDALRWTPYMSECLRELEQAQASPLDAVLVQQVKAQLVVEKASLGIWYDATLGQNATPPAVYERALQAELDALETQLPANIESKDLVILRLHIHAAILAVGEMAVKGVSTAVPLSIAHLQVLHYCVETVAKWFEMFFFLPASEYSKFSFLMLSHAKQCLGAAFALSTLENVAWDKEAAQERLRPVEVLETIADGFARTSRSRQSHDEANQTNIFGRVANVMRATKQIFQTTTAGRNSDTWDRLNSTINGRLIRGQPPASVCYPDSPNYNADACHKVIDQWNSSAWHGNNPISITEPPIGGCYPIYPNGTSIYGDRSAGARGCNIDTYPVYVVNASGVTDVQAGMNFAREHSLRLNVKGTGHGNSSIPGSLSIWTHHLREMEFHGNFVAQGDNGTANSSQMAIAFGAGAIDREAFEFAAKHDAVVVGGTDSTVGLMGWAGAGGHGYLTGAYGMGADNTLEATIVLASGEVVVANEIQNSNVFWAIRGGGAGTWGVVTSLTLKAYPMPSTVMWSLTLSARNQTSVDDWYRVVAHVMGDYPRLKSAGLGGYVTLSGPPLIMANALFAYD